jgi:hypothetical protein
MAKRSLTSLSQEEVNTYRPELEDSGGTDPILLSITSSAKRMSTID